MPKLTDEDVKAALAPQLEEGESIRHWAYGVKQPNIFLLIFLIALAVVPGIIAVFLLTKNYFLVLTDRRLLAIQVKGVKPDDIKTITEYSLAELSSENVKTSTGGLFTHIAIQEEEKPFKAKFHRAFCETNRPHAMAIAEAIS
ncbi:MAG: hypothetical protein MI807_18065 [Verrucomicrobiales bacterium]|nr:hypothetical protein [Verrucomicrobiales bacterium]